VKLWARVWCLVFLRHSVDKLERLAATQERRQRLRCRRRWSSCRSRRRRRRRHSSSRSSGRCRSDWRGSSGRGGGGGTGGGTVGASLEHQVGEDCVEIGEVGDREHGLVFVVR